MAQVRLLSKAEFARLAGVSKPAISKALAGALAGAVVSGEINAFHPAAVAYLATRGKEPPSDGAPTPPTRRGRPPAAPPTGAADPEPDPEPAAPAPRPGRHHRTEKRQAGLPKVGHGEDLALVCAESDTWGDLTMRQIADRWGTFKEFAGVLDALKTLEDIRKTRLHNEETEGSLIERDLVKTHVFGALEAANRRLLNDFPRTVARRLYAAAKSGQEMEEAERIVRDLISSILRPEKDRVTKVLRG